MPWRPNHPALRTAQTLAALLVAFLSATQRWVLAVLIILSIGGMEWLASSLRPSLLKYRARSLAGLSMVFPVAPLVEELPNAKTARRNAQVGLRALRQAVGNAASLDLLLASGFQFIGTPRTKGWLFDTLERNAGKQRLRVLLLDPECEESRLRAAEVMGDYPWDHYQEGTRAVLHTLHLWQRDRGLDVEVRLYQEPPIWQIIQLPAELWILMSADGRSTESSPWFILRRNQRFGLAWGLEAVWRRRWDHELTRTVDLETVEPPDWSKIKVDPDWDTKM